MQIKFCLNYLNFYIGLIKYINTYILICTYKIYIIYKNALIQVQNLQSLRALNFSNKNVSIQVNLTNLKHSAFQSSFNHCNFGHGFLDMSKQIATQTHNHDPWVCQKITGQCRPNIREKQKGKNLNSTTCRARTFCTNILIRKSSLRHLTHKCQEWSALLILQIKCLFFHQFL